MIYNTTTDGMVLQYVEKSIASFDKDAPDSDFQKGFLAAAPKKEV